MCKSAFANCQITSPITKYHHCVGKLPAEAVAMVEDVVNNYAAFADPYTELKQRLCRVFSSSDMQKVKDLLDLPNLGSQKPSVLIDNILSLWPNTTTKNTSNLLRCLFLHRLPLQMRSQLTNYPANSPIKLNDAIWSQSGSQVSAAVMTVAEVTSGCPCLLSPRSGAGGSRGHQAQAPKSSGGASKKKWPCNHTPAANSLCFYYTNFGALA